ncbi:ANKRD17 [Symbiodinium sp. CCMP2592]|nr:ANKRD17 [Symbiodinium sp. CCMP2592]
MAAATFAADHSRSEVSYHARPFPMWVVSVSDMLRMRAPAQPHAELLKSGQLVLHEAKMYTVFVSHQWLGRHHPDPDGKQLVVLQEAIAGCISGRLLKSDDSVARMYIGNRPTASKERSKLRDGYMWLDWFCIPQDAEEHENQLLAIRSIPSYVEHCSMFVALVPELRHESGSACDYESWLRRGWCLAELWCAQLSNSRSSMQMIVIRGPLATEFAMPQTWVYTLPHEGDFTLEADRSHIREMLAASLQARIAFLEANEVQPGVCRYLKCRSHDWVGPRLSPTQRSEEDFLSHFGFPSLAKALKVKQIGALACAVLTDDIPMIRRLVQARACLGTRCTPPLVHLDVLTWTPLHLAVHRGSRALPVMAELLRLRADPNSTDSIGLPLLGNSRDAATVEFLVQHHADVNFQTGISKVSPIGLSAARIPQAAVISKLLELRADVNGSEARGGLGHSALVNLIWESRHLQNTGVALAAQLVSARADVNASGRSTGLFRCFEVVYRAAACLGSTDPWAVFHANSSSSPLGYAALSGHVPMVSFLLAARADPDLPNSRGRSPRQLADSRTQHLFSAPVLKSTSEGLTDSEEHLTRERSPEGLADSDTKPLFSEGSPTSHEMDLPAECMQKPLQSRSVRAPLFGSRCSEGLVVVRL